VRRALLLVVLLAGCDEPLFGPPTESTCPDDQTLTYENFGKKFMEDYCVECHDSKKMGDDRQGATSFHDFDTLFGIEAVHEHIDLTTASGPAATNTSMPPDGEPTPSEAERKQLGEWIACDMPRDMVTETRTLAPGQQITGTIMGPAKGKALLRLRASIAELGWRIEDASAVAVGEGQMQSTVDYEFSAPARASYQLILSNEGTTDISVDIELLLFHTVTFAWN
jgi:mono/diheme cytochrome c family protein